MSHQLQLAIKLREEGDFAQSRQILMQLVSQYPNDAVINYQCAWTHDAEGREHEAVIFYERAIELGLAEKDLEEAYIGLGSTYRCIGEYRKSISVIQQGLTKFPTSRVMTVFLAMAKYNLGEHTEAMQLLLTNIAETSADASIKQFKRAILFYSDKLDQTW